MNTVVSNCPPQLNCCDRQTLINYFQEAWQLEDMLLKSLVGEDTFYLNPDPLRNPLIFYLGHSPSFYINKLVQVGLLEKCLNQDYEILFGVGVDPEIPEELNQAIAHMEWPEVSSAWEYREQAYKILSELIQKTPITLPILPDSPLWALIMGIEHQRIHVETSSMLFRQLPLERVKRPSNWKYAPSKSYIPENEMLKVAGGIAQLGKDFDDSTYGWDIDYGSRTVEVAPFLASKYLITNSEFLDFVKAGGYGNQEYWDEKSWQWKTENNIQHPKFWISQNGSYKYRAQFDEIDLPLDWPVEVNYYEAMAYCRWQGKDTRLMSEAEYNVATYGNGLVEDVDDYNLNFKFGSPSPVGMLETAKSPSGLYDLRGNVWEWLSDNLNPLSGYEPHFLYEDNSAIFFDTQHQMMLGGCWITNGTEALKYYRNWFRPNFYQHAGFRIVRDI
ncbi:5-histidylcysteine sulfoxide synthase [Planktothrix agardhii]|jgi:5-histidylcysteine sulfoxide synthase|uniref:Sulfatase-modifying factor enzyme-like domain-containing protein n=1 Tax=Planktothrix agardhii TaxID=1160 RepID=A0A1J1JJ24_PLAAG|nr:5-histidylcysteine sulfoxide synthase [Planktothrix agardhii]MBG0745071.1 5-histidylcysteine sulfoxide synthase [Planktothrix agardhii KL2]MCF3576531.1 5-histidylcysteine sulfoxide synthase [Planktothrix agardhii 1812]MCF3578384.1 5-histidylcysteine sulfoxide synthase [Planktothrix agardhii 1812]MCF3582564.1 5-histidylcysteine sulfoxide synthase [Planktothrix agardhii 1811]MCF3624222.1 5-histidylcysteine sulfoxide synthase [Planktothrix agardhii 1801]